MGNVLAFQPRDAASIRKPPVAGGTASVVIFPGIRYERHDGTTPAPSAKSETRRGKPRPSH